MMTVKELIDELKEYPEDYTVKVVRDAIASDIYAEDIRYGLDNETKELVI